MARKLGHRILNLATARTYVPYQDLETKRMLLDFLEKPESFIEHMRRFSASLTTQMTFGFRTTTIHDPRFKESFDVCTLSTYGWPSKLTLCRYLMRVGSWLLLQLVFKINSSGTLLIVFRSPGSWTSSPSSGRFLTSFFLSNEKQKSYTKERLHYSGTIISRPGENCRTGQPRHAPLHPA